MAITNPPLQPEVRDVKRDTRKGARRDTFLPFALPSISDDEIREVADSLRSGWITTGPKTKRFEEEFAAFVGVDHAVAVSSCTAALHVALTALNVGAGDEVILPTLTFCSTANVVVHLGAKPVLVDVDDAGHISIDAIERAITPRTKVLLPVHYAGQACDLDAIRRVAAGHGLQVVEDAAHAVGAEYGGRQIGSHGNAVAFSFYAIKNMTTGEGGMVTTADAVMAERMRRLSLHGMTRDAWRRYAGGPWGYDVSEPGYKDNMTDIQASLGLHQLRRLPGFILRRRDLAGRYRAAFARLPELILPAELPNRTHTYHLFPVRLRSQSLGLERDQFIDELKRRNVGSSVHFIPVHRHSFYAKTYGYREDQFPVAEGIFSGLLSLPLYPSMTDDDADDVINAVTTIIEQYR
jgi:dTDP-4-amino-4,6-dideoxygalactose transaminase